MLSVDKDALIDSFLEITATADPNEAKRFLEFSNWDISDACSCWLESHNSVDDGRSGVASSKDFRDVEPPYERLPDKIYSNQLIEGILPENERVVLRMAQTFGTNDATIDSTAGLAKLYKPPTEINCHKSFELAMEEARTSFCFLLVNIQSNDYFECHVLNRDIWSNEHVQEVLKARFVFWQRECEDENSGRIFCQLYNVSQYPYIGVIHPRTGKEMKFWGARFFTDPVIAISQLYEFYESNMHSLQPSVGLEHTPATGVMTCLSDPVSSSSHSAAVTLNQESTAQEETVKLHAPSTTFTKRKDLPLYVFYAQYTHALHGC